MPSRDAPTRTRALLLSRVDYGEADVIVHVLTEQLGHVPALARGARRSQKRFGGSLEPIHTLRIDVVDRARGELMTLRESELERPRLRITSDLDALEAAGKALKWVRRAVPVRTPDPLSFEALESFLNELETGQLGASSRSHLAAFGLHLLEGLGWGLTLDRCVSCGKSCPDQSVALMSPERGGLLCRACGGAPLRIAASSRSEMRRAAAGTLHALTPEATQVAIPIIDRALGAHLGID